MTTTIAIPASPVTNGATVIQANALTLVASDYASISWESAQRWVSSFSLGKEFFDFFPSSRAADPNWTFYIRADMTGAEAGQKTLIGIETVVKKATRSALNATTMQNGSFSAPRVVVTAHIWYVITVTLTNGSVYNDVNLSRVTATLPRDPESYSLPSASESWEMIHEALGFLLLPVAAGAPTFAPAMKALAGQHPLA